MRSRAITLKGLLPAIVALILILPASPACVNVHVQTIIPPSASLLLSDHRKAQERLLEALGQRLTEESLIFTTDTGKPMLPDSVSHAWIKMAQRAGLEGVRFHDARHSHASLLLKQGVHPKVVQERLGHSSIQITLDTYSHVAPGMQEAAAKGFDRAMPAPARLPGGEATLVAIAH